MARYGRVKIGSNENYIKFENVAARRDFAEAFEAYHNAHEHAGDVPTFQEISTKDVQSYHTTDAPAWGDKYLTIDGYKAKEIYEYHTHEGYGLGPSYKPPTCCISPLIVLDTVNLGGDGPFVDSGALERHPLSAVFGDMPLDDFQSLLKSVKDGGFFDPLIRMHEGKVLDGWHRYKAALELNIVRKLRFTVWQDEDEGDPAAFVLARNVERRHLGASQRAQIIVAFNERFARGDIDSQRDGSPRGVLKTHKELAEKANVGTSTIDRAIVVEKAGRAEEVIAGKKTATEVIAEVKSKSEGMPLTGVYFLASKGSGYIKIGFSSQLSRRIDEIKGSSPEPLELLHTIPDASLDIESTLHNKFQHLRTGGEWFEGSQELLQYIDSLKKSEAVIAGEKTASEVITEVTLESLWEQVNAAIPAWKKKREGVGHASKTMLIHATLKFHSLPHDSETNVDILKKLLHLLSASTTDILEIFVRKQLRGESLWKTDDTAVDPEKLPLQDAIEEMKADESEVNPEKSESTVEDDSPKDRDSLLEEWQQARASVKDLWENDKEISQTIRYLDHFQERILAYYPPWIRPDVWKPGIDSARKVKIGEIIAEIKQFKQIASDIQSRADWVKEMLFPDTELAKEANSEVDSAPSETVESDNLDPDEADALEKFRNQKHELYTLINKTPLVDVKDEFGNVNTDKATHQVMLAAYKAYDLSADLLWSDGAIEGLPADEIRKITGKYFLMVQDLHLPLPLPVWVSGLYESALEEDGTADEDKGIAEPKEQADAQTTDSEISEYRLESITLGYQKKGQDISDGISTMSFQVIASRQLGEYPMLELPETLRHEILKLIEEKA